MDPTIDFLFSTLLNAVILAVVLRLLGGLF